MSRQGKTGDSVVGNMRDCEPGLQASIWLAIAESSPFKEEQLNGFSRALSILRNEDSSELVEILLSYSRWILEKGLGFRKVQETLEEAEQLAKRYMRRGWEDEVLLSANDENEMEMKKSYKKLAQGKHKISTKTSQTFSHEMELNENLNNLEEEFKFKVINQKTIPLEQKRLQELEKSKLEINLEENNIREVPERNVKILEQLFRVHSMKAMIADQANDQAIHLHWAGMYMKLALKVTFKRYIQLLRDKMEQPGGLTQGESILVSKEDNSIPRIKTIDNTSRKSGIETKESSKTQTEDTSNEHEIEISEKYEDNLRVEFPVGLLNLISHNRETNIICKASFDRESLTFFYLLNNLQLLQKLGIKKNCDIFILVMKLISQAFFKSQGVQTFVILISATNARHFGLDKLSKELLTKTLSGSKIKDVLHQINLEIELNSKE
jgi:hypothetical protein